MNIGLFQIRGLNYNDMSEQKLNNLADDIANWYDSVSPEQLWQEVEELNKLDWDFETNGEFMSAEALMLAGCGELETLDSFIYNFTYAMEHKGNHKVDYQIQVFDFCTYIAITLE